MAEMEWHEAVLDELRRTRAAAEKIVGMLQTTDRPVRTEHGDRLVNEDNSFVKPQSSYADWRRKAHEAALAETAHDDVLLDQTK
jgi:hypothetical protein